MTALGGDHRPGRPPTSPVPAPTGVPHGANRVVRNASWLGTPFWRLFAGMRRRGNAGWEGSPFWRSLTGYARKSKAGWTGRWGMVLLFGAAGALGVAVSAHIARGGPLLSARWRLLGELTVWAVAWVAAVVAAFRLPRRAALPLIFGMAVALRLAALAGPPTTTDDFHRYSWDGRVQASGVDPYRYAPAAPQLGRLREPWLWPEERPCPLAYRPTDCTRINRPTVHTIYPPVAEAWFAAIYWLTGIGARWKPWQVAGLLTDVGVVALLAMALRRRGKDPRWTALYALSPAPVLEIVNNGHVDGLAILLALAAFVALDVTARRGENVAGPPMGTAGRRRYAASGFVGREGRREYAAGALGTTARWPEYVAGAFIGAAALVKLFPALLVLAMVAALPDRRRALVGIGGAAAVVTAVGYLPHVLQVGTKVIGFLPGYLREEQYAGAGRYLVAGGLRLPGGLAGLASAGALVAAATWVWRHRPPAASGAALLLGVLLLAVSPVQPWYAVTLLAFATLTAQPRWAAVVAAGYPYFFAVILLHPQRVGIGQLSYGLAAAAVALPALLRGSPAPARSMEGCPTRGC